MELLNLSVLIDRSRCMYEPNKNTRRDERKSAEERFEFSIPRCFVCEGRIR